jgi:hypothetical protein
MVLIGFGEFKGYKLQEIPDVFLAKLAEFYSLKHSAHDGSGKVELRATIAVHEELQRRAVGGKISKRLPFRKEIATKLVNAGFRHLSKEYHPDRVGGDVEAQKMLSEMRDYLLSTCSKILEPERKGAFVIPDPDSFAQSAEISDDDIPF